MRRLQTNTMSEGERVLAGIRALVRRFAVSERADVSVAGMTVAQRATLEALVAEAPLRLGDLARRLGISPSTLTRNLARLEERELVRRAPDPDDTRAQRVELTAVGRRAATCVRSDEVEFARAILRHIPPAERASVVSALEHLLAAVREATESCCPGAFDHLMTGFPCCSPRAGD